MSGGLTITGQPVPPERLGRLSEVADRYTWATQLPMLLRRDGYLLLRQAPALRAVSHRAALGRIAQALFGEPCIPFDCLWRRSMVEGRASPLHFDHVYMNRSSQRLVTAWIPLGDVPLHGGPLLVVEGSHCFDDLITRFRGVDVDRTALPGSFPQDALSVPSARGARPLGASYIAR